MNAKAIWIKADSSNWDAQKGRITTSLESGVACVLTTSENIESVRELGDIRVASPVGGTAPDIVVVGVNGEGDGTQPLPSDLSGSMDIITAEKLSSEGKTVAGYVVIRNKKYEQFATEMGRVCDYLIAIGTDWKVIPLENLIASLFDEDVVIMAGVQNSEEAKLAIETLEHGADGVLIDTDDPSEIKRIVGVVERAGTSAVPLQTARVTAVKPVGMGDRVCVDTCYLVTTVNAKGEQKDAIVGRVKIERRPLTLVEAEVDGNVIKTLLQNAETIKLVGADGAPISIANLKIGDEVLVHFEDSARHFGMKIDETIIEK